MNKKGMELNSLPTIAVLLGVGVVALAIAATISTNVQETQCDYNFDDRECRECPANESSDVASYNATGNECYWVNGTTGVSYTINQNTDFNVSYKGGSGFISLSNWLPTLGLIIGAFVVISILAMLGYVNMKH